MNYKYVHQLQALIFNSYPLFLFQVIYHSIMFCNQVVKFNHNQSFGAILTPDGFGWAIGTAYILMTVYCANLSFGEKNLDSKEGHLRLSVLALST